MATEADAQGKAYGSRRPYRPRPRSRDSSAVATAPAKHATAQVPNAAAQAARRAVPPNRSSATPNSSVPTNPPAKPMQEYVATIAPRCRGSPTASTPEVRLEKLPCTTKPATSASPTTAAYGNPATSPNRP